MTRAFGPTGYGGKKHMVESEYSLAHMLDATENIYERALAIKRGA
jgi:hypothetical protein